ncbi:MAG: hypothetical protein Q9160_005907 [Pyrenula sp. 1 TL-2023]
MARWLVMTNHAILSDQIHSVAALEDKHALITSFVLDSWDLLDMHTLVVHVLTGHGKAPNVQNSAIKVCKMLPSAIKLEIFGSSLSQTPSGRIMARVFSFAPSIRIAVQDKISLVAAGTLKTSSSATGSPHSKGISDGVWGAISAVAGVGTLALGLLGYWWKFRRTAKAPNGKSKVPRYNRSRAMRLTGIRTTERSPP